MTVRFNETVTDLPLGLRVVPFDPSAREALLSGQQTATTRRKPIGKAGSRFVAFGQVFEIVSMANMLLATIATRYFDAEGYATPDAFRVAWAERHPRRGWQPGHVAYHHVIRMVQ